MIFVLITSYNSPYAPCQPFVPHPVTAPSAALVPSAPNESLGLKTFAIAFLSTITIHIYIYDYVFSLNISQLLHLWLLPTKHHCLPTLRNLNNSLSLQRRSCEAVSSAPKTESRSAAHAGAVPWKVELPPKSSRSNADWDRSKWASPVGEASKLSVGKKKTKNEESKVMRVGLGPLDMKKEALLGSKLQI